MLRAGAAVLVALVVLGSSGCLSVGRGGGSTVPNQLAYVGLDDQIYTLPLEGGDAHRVSVAAGETAVVGGQRLSRWPTWSADGSRLAFMRFDVSYGSEVKSSIYVVNADGSGLTRVFESDSESPIYMAWSPDAAWLTLLTQIQRQLRLELVDPSAAAAPRVLAEGGPIYFAWSPDGQSILLHVNGDARSERSAVLRMMQPGTGGEAATQLSARPTDFRAPAWSPNGARLAYAAQAPEGQSVLAVQEVGVGESARLLLLGSEPAFLWSPSSDRLAFSSHYPMRPILHRGLETIKVDGSDRQLVTDGDVAAFYWSPDGRKLAFAALETTNRSLIWFVSDPDGKNRRQVASFYPSETQLFMFAFFDQYAQSHAVWSPDSKFLIYSGAAVDGPRAKVFDPLPVNAVEQDEPTQVFAVAADGNSAPRVVVDGTLGLGPVPGPRGR